MLLELSMSNVIEGHNVKTTALNGKLQLYTYVQSDNLKVSRPIKVQHQV